MSDQTLSVIGLGKLGSPLLAVLAAAVYDVVGVDTNPLTVEAINAGRAPVNEPKLQELLSILRGAATRDGRAVTISPLPGGTYRATTDTREAVLASDATFVIVPTPSGQDGGFTLDYILPAMRAIGAALAEKTTPHLVVIVSTVMPGQTAQACAALERTSGKRNGDGFHLCYSPTFIALGNVIENLQAPDYALIGAESDVARAWLSTIYGRIHNAPLVCTNWVNAEVAKIAQNAYITMKITFANQLGALCERLPGGNVDEVTRALGHDRRVGKHYLKAGTAFGGPCFPRDGVALARAYAEAGVEDMPDPSLFEMVGLLNELETARLVRVIQSAHHRCTVGIIGASYKSGTPCVEESASIALARALDEECWPVVVCDKLAHQEAFKALAGDILEITSSVQRCVDVCDVLVLMHPDGAQTVAGLDLSGKVIIDPWRSMGHAPDGARLIALGVGQVGEGVTA